MQETLEQLLARLKAEIEDAEHGDVDRAELARLAKAVESKLADESDETDDDDESLTEDLTGRRALGGVASGAGPVPAPGRRHPRVAWAC